MSDPRSSTVVVRVVLDAAAHSNEPAVGVVRQMLGAFGYDLTDPSNSARANDQLVRSHASGVLAEAARLLVHLEASYRDEYVPPASREQPFPPADVMKALKNLDTLRRRVGEVSSTVLTQETPGVDSVWERLRRERGLLEQLVAADIGVVAGAEDVREAARALTPADVRQKQLNSVETPLAAVEVSLRSRRGLLE